MQNFTRPKNEKPYYYSTTVENGKVVSHEGDEQHAVYLSEIKETERRAALYHDWLEKNVPNAYEYPGIVREGVYAKTAVEREEFMSGVRNQ